MVTLLLALLGSGAAFAVPVPPRFRVFDHFTPYRFNNSPAGVRKSARSKNRIDLDFQETLDEVWAWTHWGRLWIEGFRYTKASVAVAARYGIKATPGKLCMRTCKTTPYALIATLRTSKGDRIGTAGEAIKLAAVLDVDLELETKGNPSQAMFDRLATRCRIEYGANWRNHAIVKRIWKAGATATLHRAEQANDGKAGRGRGFRTIAIQIRGRNAAKIPADYYRR